MVTEKETRMKTVNARLKASLEMLLMKREAVAAEAEVLEAKTNELQSLGDWSHFIWADAT